MAKVSEEHLIPFNKLTVDEQRKIASNGGKKSGEVRRAKKQLKECLSLILEQPVKNKSALKAIAELGVPTDQIDNKMLTMVALFRKAIQDGGDIAAIKEIRSILGEEESKVEKTVEDDELTKSLEERAKKL